MRSDEHADLFFGVTQIRVAHDLMFAASIRAMLSAVENAVVVAAGLLAPALALGVTDVDVDAALVARGRDEQCCEVEVAHIPSHHAQMGERQASDGVAEFDFTGDITAQAMDLLCSRRSIKQPGVHASVVHFELAHVQATAEEFEPLNRIGGGRLPAAIVCQEPDLPMFRGYCLLAASQAVTRWAFCDSLLARAWADEKVASVRQSSFLKATR